jgi:hypothetical protein
LSPLKVNGFKPTFSDEPDTIDGSFLAFGDEEDEINALEEARLAVEQVVLPKGQPVELLPRSSKLRQMQHELVERYHMHWVEDGELYCRGRSGRHTRNLTKENQSRTPLRSKAPRNYQQLF